MPASAFQLTAFYGTNNHVSLEACCNSAGTRPAFGALASVNPGFVDAIEIAGLTSGKWNEITLLYPFDIFGRAPRVVKNELNSQQEKFVSKLRFVSSLGVGYFNHTLTTKDLGLPLLTSGFLINNYNRMIWQVFEHYSVNGMFQLGIASTKSGSSLISGLYIGIGYDF